VPIITVVQAENVRQLMNSFFQHPLLEKGYVVGRMISSTLWRSASFFTSSITGNAPFIPVPITKVRHFQGISSSMDNGVWPKSPRNFLD
jgi:hypothetical protein